MVDVEQAGRGRGDEFNGDLDGFIRRYKRWIKEYTDLRDITGVSASSTLTRLWPGLSPMPRS